jgi:ACS family hexuronate transporter-like MFS transporter
VRWIILGLLFLSTVLNYIDRQALSVLVPTLRVDLKLTAAEYGDIATLFMLAYGLAQVFAGRFIDRAGTKIGLTLCVLVWSVAAVSHSFVQGVMGLAIARFMLGIGEAGNWPAGAKAIAEWFPSERRAFAMGVFDGGSALGAILAPPLVAALALLHGWRTTFVATGAMGFIWLIGWLFIYRRPKTSQAAAPAESPKLFRKLLTTRQLWGLMITRMVATPVWWFYVFWLPDYLGKGRGFSLKEIGLFGWIPFVTVDAGKLIGGTISDRLLASGISNTVARKSVMVAAALCMAAGTRVAGADSAALAITWVSIATFGFGMWSANILALHADMFPSEAMASAVGLTGTAASLGGAALTFVTGHLVDAYGYAPAFWIVGSLALFALISLFLILKTVEEAQLYAVSQ